MPREWNRSSWVAFTTSSAMVVRPRYSSCSGSRVSSTDCSVGRASCERRGGAESGEANAVGTFASAVLDAGAFADFGDEWALGLADPAPAATPGLVVTLRIMAKRTAARAVEIRIVRMRE